MKIKTVLFDLDGTLLPMDQEVFVADYIKRLAVYMTQYGYDAKAVSDAVMEGVFVMVKNDGSKPDPEYYKDILNRLGLQAEECLMVGNDTKEDTVPAA